MADTWNKVEEVNSDIFSFVKEKDEFVGVLKKIKKDVGPNNSNLYEFKTEKGAEAIWGSTILDARLDNEEMLGKEIKIVYLGTKPAKTAGRRPCKNYDVFSRDVDKTQDEADF